MRNKNKFFLIVTEVIHVHAATPSHVQNLQRSAIIPHRVHDHAPSHASLSRARSPKKKSDQDQSLLRKRTKNPLQRVQRKKNRRRKLKEMLKLTVRRRKTVQRQLMEMKKMAMLNKNWKWRMKLKRTNLHFSAYYKNS